LSVDNEAVLVLLGELTGGANECYLQGAMQLKRVKRQRRGPPRIVGVE